MTMVGKQGGGRRVAAAAAAAAAATTARATVRTQTRVSVMVVEVGGVKGAKEALTQTINDRTLLKSATCYCYSRHYRWPHPQLHLPCYRNPPAGNNTEQSCHIRKDFRTKAVKNSLYLTVANIISAEIVDENYCLKNERTLHRVTLANDFYSKETFPVARASPTHSLAEAMCVHCLF
jgi:hypothetical protein